MRDKFQHTTNNLTEPFKATTSGELRFNCPYCPDGDLDFHLYVNPKKQKYHCFKCNASGQVPTELLGTYITVLDSVRKQNKPEDSISKRITEKPLSVIGKSYLLKRGLTKEEIDIYAIREGTHQLSGRVLFPVSDRGKGIIGIIGRSYQKQKPPYLVNWLIEDHPRHVSWGDLQREIEYPQDIYALVEGVFDLVNMNRYVPTVALLGTEVDTKWFQDRFPEKQMFYIFLDPDAKVQAATASNKLCLVGFQARTFFLYKEPGDMDDQEFKELYEIMNRQVRHDKLMGKI